ncbi:Uncharacterised protein [Bordetella pertussis]|nr:Uncharacterised protein [Bordetella pertussis]
MAVGLGLRQFGLHLGAGRRIGVGLAVDALVGQVVGFGVGRGLGACAQRAERQHQGGSKGFHGNSSGSLGCGTPDTAGFLFRRSSLFRFPMAELCALVTSG